MTVEQKKSRQSSYFPETKASPKKKYYGKIEMFNLEQDDSNDVIADDDAVIDDKPENTTSNPQNVPKGINRLSCKSDNLPLVNIYSIYELIYMHVLSYII